MHSRWYIHLLKSKTLDRSNRRWDSIRSVAYNIGWAACFSTWIIRIVVSFKAKGLPCAGSRICGTRLRLSSCLVREISALVGFVSLLTEMFFAACAIPVVFSRLSRFFCFLSLYNHVAAGSICLSSCHRNAGWIDREEHKFVGHDVIKNHSIA